VSVASLVDRAASGPVLVFGSLPPGGRDLDLLARPSEERTLAAALVEAGFREWSGEWVRFRECSAESLDLVPTGRWGLAPGELDALFAEALPLEPYRQLVRPSPDHVLLLLALLVVAPGGRLTQKHLDRVERALEEDPRAWARAAGRAAAWGVADALDELREGARAGAPRPGPTAAGRRVPRRTVSFSGLDASGKSSHAEALHGTLERLGIDSVVVWSHVQWDTIEGNRLLDRLSEPVKRVLRLAKRRSAPVSVTSAAPARADPGRELRQRSRLVSGIWISFVALVHARAQRRALAPHLRAGRVVVCDRYTLDSIVHLRNHYGASQVPALAILLLRLLSPRELRAYFLDLSPEESLSRRHEQYGLEELARHAELYRGAHQAVGARRLDATRPREDLCAEIAEEVWRALS